MAITGTIFLVPYLWVKSLQIIWRFWHPQISSTGVRSSNELQRFDYMIGYQDSRPSNGFLCDIPYWNVFTSYKRLMTVIRIKHCLFFHHDRVWSLVQLVWLVKHVVIWILVTLKYHHGIWCKFGKRARTGLESAGFCQVWPVTLCLLKKSWWHFSSVCFV